jgi:ribosomal protein S18 acetylase RimI-like enzyme
MVNKVSVKVRPFEHGDADAVLRLYQSVGVWFEDVEVTREYIISSSERPDFRFMVAVEVGTVVGFIGALYYTLVGRAEIGPVGVDPGQRGIGIGGALMEAMTQFLVENGIKRAYVKVKGENVAAISFFMGLGFSHEAYLRGYTLNGEDVVQLVSLI